MTAEYNALRLLASFDWKPFGSTKLIANAHFTPIMAEAIAQDLGEEGMGGLGLQFRSGKAYIGSHVLSWFEKEGLPLKICKAEMAR